eukprot:1248644-Prymnesium_polylepis.1
MRMRFPRPRAPPPRAQTCPGAHSAHTARLVHKPRCVTHTIGIKSHAAPAHDSPSTAPPHSRAPAHAPAAAQPLGPAAPFMLAAAPNRAASPALGRSGPAQQPVPARTLVAAPWAAPL